MEASLGKIIAENLVFKGDEGNPFLAPRGIWMTKNFLFISDTGQNRVFIWKNHPSTEYKKPDVVLGQIEKGNKQRNAGKSVTATTLQYPSGIWSDEKRLIVADAWNHRVLIWNSMPTKDGQSADVVIGQPDFNSNQPNVEGIGAEPNAQKTNWPYGVFSDGKQLWIADTGNRRVLYFNEIPNKNFAEATNVIGQQDLNSKDYDSDNPIWPYSVRVSTEGKLAITDTQYYRVLLWNNWQDAFTKQADSIIGQKAFNENGQNQYSFLSKANTLNWCYDSFFKENGIWVADTGNSRLLWFETVPNSNNYSANDLFGHDNFETGSENMNTILGTENALYWPFSICILGEKLAVADTGNHRVIFKKLNS